MAEHIIGFSLGFIMDLIIGDPYNIPHPIRLIGSLIGWLDKALLNTEKGKTSQRFRGFLMLIIVTGLTVTVTGAILFGAYKINKFLGIAIEAILTCYILATKSLNDESMKVYKALKTGSIEDSRKAVSMIVGRDTNNLDAAGVAKAAVETVAENTSDGVIAPLIYTCIGGPVLGMLYKAINTMDSMVGYHNDRYENFGFFAAKADDVVNFIPARLSALLMILATVIAGNDFSTKRAFRIFRRDRYNHKSPNSAQTESVCAGALGVRLAGDASYFGKVVKKPYIGNDYRQIEAEDIKRINRLMYTTAILAFAICLAVLGILR